MIVALWLFGLLGALVVLSYAFARVSVYPPRAVSRGSEELGERVSFDSLDGLPLTGWWVAGSRPATIILCHGHAMSHRMMRKYVAFMNAAGFNVLLFDFRGRGASGGERTSIGFHEVADLMGALEVVRQRGGGAVGVFGISMGGAVAIRAAAVCPEIRAVATEAAYARLSWGIFNYLLICFGPLGLLMFPFTLFFGQQIAGFRVRLAAPMELIDKIAPRPILLIHGAWDGMIWPFHARRLFASAKEPKELWIVPRAWHAAAYRTAPEEFERKLLKFFKGQLLDGETGKRGGGEAGRRGTGETTNGKRENA